MLIHCEFCDQRFDSEIDYIFHKEISHDASLVNENEFLVEDPFEFRRRLLHEAIPEEDRTVSRPSVIQYCNSVYENSTAVSQHDATPISSNYLCDKCGDEFSDESLLQCHFELVHSNIEQNINLDINSVEDPLEYVRHFNNSIDEDTELNVQNRPSVIQYALPKVEVVPTSALQQANIDIVAQALEGSVVRHYRILNSNNEELNSFLSEARDLVTLKLQEELNRLNFIKFGLLLDTTFVNVDGEISNRGFISRNRTITITSQLQEIIEECFQELLIKITEHEARGSGWSLNSIIGLDLRVHKSGYGDRGSSYIPLPKSIESTHACINVKNHDNECFRYAMLVKHISGGHLQRPNERYNEVRNKYNFNGLKYPVTLANIKSFELKNPGVSINVFGLDTKNNIYPLKVVSQELHDHTDLLLITDDNVSHYVFISNFNKLIKRQLSKMNGAITVCKRCFNFKRLNSQTAGGKNWLLEHSKLCDKNVPVRTKLPSPNSSILKFNKPHQQYRIPIAIYADFESCLIPLDTADPDAPGYVKCQLHEPNSYCFLVKSTLTKEHLEKYGIPTEPQIYRGENVAEKFLSQLYDIAEKVSRLYSLIVPMRKLTDLQDLAHLLADECYLCCKEFTEENYKVHDHDHLTGEYRGPACNSCNINFKLPNFIPVAIHNLSGYDSHIIIPELGNTKGDIDVIAQNTEKFISFSKKVGNIKLRFIDSLRFMPSSLMTLSNNLLRKDLKETRKLVPDEKVDLVLRKGVFPYDYIDSLEKFEERSLPPKEEFYSKLNDTPVDAEDYAHAVRVWNELNITTLGEYSDFYVTLDVTLLCDVMEEFRNACMKSYGLDPLHFFSSPGLAWQAMMKETKCELQLLTDIDMLLMVENGIRGGLVQSVTRYVKANNQHIPNHNKDEDSVYIGYFDSNNLYGWAMSMPLPYSGFFWRDPDTLGDILSIPKHGDIGFILDFDFIYPEYLHDQHFDLPLLPRSEKPVEGKHQKLLATLEDKTNYIGHFWIVQQAVELGIVITKINRVLQFNQKCWLKPYIESNTKRRAAATSNFQKDFFKQMNNSVYGKTLEDKKKHLHLRLVNDAKTLEKLVKKPNFKTSIIINENLVAVCMNKTTVKMDRPVYVGMSILDISKTLMYEFHYKKMLSYYNRENICIAYMDTDAFVYRIKTDNMYEDLKMYPFRNDFDLSDYPTNHPSYDSSVNKKQIGKFKDETCSVPITEFVTLMSKMYAMKLVSENEEEGRIIKKAKGIKKSYINSNMRFEHYYNCLFEGVDYTAKFNTIRSFNHRVHTIRITKKSLSSSDDKRVVLEGNINTLPYGHYSIRNSK